MIGVDGISSHNHQRQCHHLQYLTGFTLSGFTINGRLIIDTNTGTLNLENLDVNYTATVNYPIFV